MKRKILLQLVVPLLGLCILFVLLAFDPGQSSRETELLEMSVIFRESDGSVQSASRQGMEQAAADLGVELRLLSPSSGNDPAEQAELLGREVDGGAGAILLIPADREVLAPAVEAAARETSVVTLETDMRDFGAAAWVGVDNKALGEALGTAALNGAMTGQRVLVVDSVPGDTGVADRLEAAKTVLEAAGRKVELCRGGEGQSLSDALAAKLELSRPALLLAFEPTGLEQAAQAAQALENPPLVYGMGSTAAIAADLEQGGITAIAAQNEFAAGYLAVAAAVSAAGHKPAQPAAPLEFTLVRQESMYDPDNQKLLFPVTR